METLEWLVGMISLGNGPDRQRSNPIYRTSLAGVAIRHFILWSSKTLP